MLPLLPIIASAISSTILIYRKNQKAEVKTNHIALANFARRCGVYVSPEGRFDPNTRIGGVPLLFISMSNLGFLNILLDYGADPNICDANGLPAILYAIKEKPDKFVLSSLLNHGANPNAMDSNGKTAIFYACENQLESHLRLLQYAGADVNAVDKTGKTALFYSFSNSSLDALLECGADVNAKDDNGNTVLFYISGPEEFHILNKLEAKGLNIHALDNMGNEFKYLNEYLEYNSYNHHSLYEAVNSNNIAGARYHLEHGANLDTRDSCISNWNMIHLAVYKNNPEMIELLVTHGVDINGRCTPTSPLEKSVFDNNFECFKKLLELGADPKLAKNAVKYTGTEEMKILFKKYYKEDM